MVILGIDAHDRTHTVVVIDERGREICVEDHDDHDGCSPGAVRWAERFGAGAGVGGGGLPTSVAAPRGRSARRR